MANSAVIYIRTDAAMRDVHAYCTGQNYHVAGVVVDPDGQRWYDALALVQAGRAEVIVVHQPTDPPPERIPRIEVVTIAPATPQRRPRRIDRAG